MAETIRIFLDITLSGFDGAIIDCFHNLSKFGSFFTPFFILISAFGEKGYFFIVLSIILMLFKKSRKLGFTMLLSLGIGALFTNVILKNFVQRIRPFNANEKYYEYWTRIKKPFIDGYSFPSGHTTATTACLTTIFILTNKKYSYLCFIGVILMGVSRVYLLAHYPTDVIGGIIVGGTASLIATYLVDLFYKSIYKRKPKS